jgi:YaiO family outer membrane protein
LPGTPSVVAALAWVLALTAPARAQVPVQGCAADRYQCASTAYRAGELAAARTAVDVLLVERPDDADALLLSGLIALRQNDPKRARMALDRAAIVAPAYADVFVARARLHLREGRTRDARRDSDRALTLRRDHPDALALRAQLAGLEGSRQRLWTIALDQSVSRISRRTADAWYETQATLARRSGRGSVAVEVEHARRLGRSDLRVQLRADRAIGSGTVYGAAVVTADPDFRESWGLRAGGQHAATPRIDLLIDGRFSNYGAINSGSVTTGLRGWSADRGTAIKVGVIHFIDEAGTYRVGGAADVTRRLSSRLRVQGGYARYPETEAGVTRQLASGFALATYQVREALDLRVGFDRETRRGLYRRDSVKLGLSAGF